MPRALHDLSPLERDLAEEFARKVRERYRHRVLGIKVFGSRARGEARMVSDLDVWVLLDESARPDRYAISDIATDMMIERALPFEIAPCVMSRDQWDELLGLERLFPHELERDGVTL